MKAYALTDIGKTRKVNQDAQFASTEPVGELSNLFVVADGMGGHQAGDFASRYLIEHMPEYIKESGENEPVAALRKGIEAVNQELYTLSCEREELAGMGTTLVAASIQGNTAVSTGLSAPAFIRLPGIIPTWRRWSRWDR